MQPAERARDLRRDEPRDRGAAQGRLRRASASATTASPATTSRARSSAGPSSTRRRETETIEAMDRLIEWLPQQHPAGRRDHDRPRRLPPRQPDLPSDRAAHARGARLGAVDARPSAGRLLLPLHELAHRAGGRSAGSAASTSRRSAFRPSTSTSRRTAGAPAARRSIATHWDFYIAYNLFRAARRSRRASWSASRTAPRRASTRVEAGKRARPMAELGWRHVAQKRLTERPASSHGGDEDIMDFEYSRQHQATCMKRARPRSWTSTSIRTRSASTTEVAAAAIAGSRRRSIEELKAKARAAGLWNLFLPAVGAWRRPDQPRVCAALRDHGPRAVGAGGLQLLGARHRQHGDASSATARRSRRSEWLEPLLDGKIRSCFAMTEPDVASSDATNIQSSHRARRRRLRDQRPQVVDLGRHATRAARSSSSWARPIPRTPTATSSSR